MLGFGDLRALLGALQAQFALVFPLVKVAQRWHDICAGQRLPGPIVRRDLSSIGGECELRIWPQVGGDFLGVHLIDAERVRFERWVRRFETRFSLLPGKIFLRNAGNRREQDKHFDGTAVQGE